MLQRLIWTQKAEMLLEITVMDRGNLFWPQSSSILKNKMSTLKAQQPGSQQFTAAQEFLLFWGMHRCCKENRGASIVPLLHLSITATTKMFLHCYFYSEVIVTGLTLTVMQKIIKVCKNSAFSCHLHCRDSPAGQGFQTSTSNPLPILLYWKSYNKYLIILF